MSSWGWFHSEISPEVFHALRGIRVVFLIILSKPLKNDNRQRLPQFRVVVVVVVV